MAHWLTPYPDDMQESWSADLYEFRPTIQVESNKNHQFLYMGDPEGEIYIRYVCYPELEKLEFMLERQERDPSTLNDPFWITTHRIRLTLKGYTKWKHIFGKLQSKKK